uniref:NADH dehydrogenase subunit 4 n=1 Tax=Neoseiulus chebalingensis TaxID=3061192 RepID=UPI0030FEC10E
MMLLSIGVMLCMVGVMGFSFFHVLFFYFLSGLVIFYKMSFLLWKFFCLNSSCLYLDKFGYLLIIMSYFIVNFMLLMNYKKKLLMFNLFYLLLFYSLMMCFLVNNILLFYIFFEFSLVPLIFLILMKGGSIERFMASVYLFMYTFFSSLFFLGFMLMLGGGSMSDICLVNILLFHKWESFYCLFLFFVFFVKMPLYGVHMWLPKAHVEAPVEGSMILAAVLLKLGCFGINRIFMWLNMYMYKNLFFFFMVFSAMSSLYISLICLRQTDVKLMIAYSSISHMGLLLGGLLSLSKLGMVGMVGMALSHGFCSSALFYLGNMCYERCKTRNLFLFKGLFYYYPFLSFFWLVFCVFNMGAPFSVNFFSEIFLVLCFLNKTIGFSLVLCLILFMTVCYSLNMYLRVSHGNLLMMNFMMKESHLDFFILFGHLLFLLIWGFKLSYFFIWI